MAESLHSILSSSYEPKYKLVERKELSLKENQTLYKLRFKNSRESVVYQIDGVIITEGLKCDYLVLAKREPKVDDAWDAVFVELKGTDVVHAIEQLDATMSNPLFGPESVAERHARIVAKSFPANKSNPTFEKARQAFKRKHKCSIKQVTSGNPDTL